MHIKNGMLIFLWRYRSLLCQSAVSKNEPPAIDSIYCAENTFRNRAAVLVFKLDAFPTVRFTEHNIKMDKKN